MQELRSFLVKARLKNEVNSGKPHRGNPEPSLPKRQEGVETIPSGSSPLPMRQGPKRLGP